jgi:hypothetical protein
MLKMLHTFAYWPVIIIPLVNLIPDEERSVKAGGNESDYFGFEF